MVKLYVPDELWINILLHRAWWLWQALTAAQLSSLENRPPLLQKMAYRRHLGKVARCLARTSARPHEARTSTQRRHSG